MPHLVAPDIRVHRSFLAAIKEFGPKGSDPNAVLAHEIEEFGGTWHRPEIFAAYVARMNAESLEDTPRPDGWVPHTNL
jgi:hypothetical protein